MYMKTNKYYPWGRNKEVFGPIVSASTRFTIITKKSDLNIILESKGAIIVEVDTPEVA